MIQGKVAHWILPLMLSGALGIAQDHEHSNAMPAEHADHMDHRFENPEDFAKTFDDPARDAWQMPDKVIAALKLKSGQIVADIGAGTGYFSVRLAKANPGFKVYGVDIESSMVSYLRSRAMKEGLSNITAVQAQPDSANLPTAVDLALIVDTYHHIPNRVDYFRKLAASLKVGGRVAIVDFKPESTMGPPKEFHFTAEKIREELRQAGFRQIEKLDFLPEQQFLIFSKR
jgi:ubiquinone/menaquinone biosynthesis C-methylase UbiE